MKVLLFWMTVLFAAMWFHDGMEGVYWHRRTLSAERRAADAEEWAAAVEAEAVEWMERVSFKEP